MFLPTFHEHNSFLILSMTFLPSQFACSLFMQDPLGLRVLHLLTSSSANYSSDLSMTFASGIFAQLMSMFFPCACTSHWIHSCPTLAFFLPGFHIQSPFLLSITFALLSRLLVFIVFPCHIRLLFLVESALVSFFSSSCLDRFQ